MIFLIVLVAWTAWRGVELSVKLLIVLGVIEAVIVLALGIWGLASPGPGGLNLQWLTTAGHLGNAHGLFLGVVFAIFAITAGTRRPRWPRRASIPGGTSPAR